VSRAQKISLGVAAAVLIGLGLVFAYLAGRGSSNDAASSDGSSTSAPAQPIQISEMQVTGAPGSHGGWGTTLTMTYVGPTWALLNPIRTSTPGTFDVRFDQQVSIDQSVLDAAATEADQHLMKLTWNPASQTLVVQATAWAAPASNYHAFTDNGKATFEVVRTPTPKLTNKCISVSEPAPYTKLNGITTVSGKAQLFEAGPMTILARVPNTGTTSTKVKTASSALEPYSKDVTLPLLDAPAEGYISAFEPSAKDGSATCEVDVPVYMSPGG